MRMNERHDRHLDEPLTPQIGGMIRGGLTVIGAYILVAMIAMSSRENDPEVLWLLAGIAVVSVGGLLLLWWLCSRERLIIDDEGVRTRSLLGKVRSLRWDAIRTAAVVHLSANDLHCWIVLSAEPDPRQVLIRKRLISMKPRDGQELRIPYGTRRCQIIGERLHMTLPQIML